MIRFFAASVLFLLPVMAVSDPHQDTVERVIDGHILPSFTRLAGATEVLKNTAAQDCSAQSDALRQAYHHSFDAWVAASHLRFGPTERDDRAFALAFWPDKKGFTPRKLTNLIKNQNPDGTTAEAFAHVSIAVRGFFALEFMLFDQTIQSLGSEAYQCALIQTIAADIDANADAILAGWVGGYGENMKHPAESGIYRTKDEAIQELYKTLLTGLQFTADTRLGRPLGSFERPRPKRAEARRSGRSLRNISMSLRATRDLAQILAKNDADLALSLVSAFDDTLALVEGLNSPTLARVSTPQGRLKVEILQQSINHLRETLNNTLGPHLGVSAGFNALDGD